jgi:TetR/AcrR family transcriptional regulator, transcriptional repressor of bet genes
MATNRRKFTRESEERRREDLILATLALIAETGVRSATVRGIAARASVTQGLIRHYFASKEELIVAAYDYHMNRMTDAVAQTDGTATACDRLRDFVRASLSPPVVDPGWVALWAAFLSEAIHDPQMRDTHEKTYRYFRDQLEELIMAVLEETNRPTDSDTCRCLAIACNAVLDGLWLEGGALPGKFAKGELVAIGLRSVGAILGVSFNEKAPDAGYDET